MKPKLSHDTGARAADAQCCVIARHCAVLALIGLAAIAVGFALPRDDRGPSGRAQAPATAAQPANPNVDEALPASARSEINDPAAKAFDYFPAQFPTPRSDADEQPATF